MNSSDWFFEETAPMKTADDEGAGSPVRAGYEERRT